MKKNHTILFAVLLFFWVACETSNVQQPEINWTWGKTSNGLRCSINLEVSTLCSAKSSELVVSSIIENVSNHKIELETIPSFSLSNTYNHSIYWCPVDIVNEKHLPANHRSTISIEKGRSITSTIDITKLEWENGASSIWPHLNFYDLIEQGNYVLSLDMQITDLSEPEWIRSNESEIVITN